MVKSAFKKWNELDYLLSLTQVKDKEKVKVKVVTEICYKIKNTIILQ